MKKSITILVSCVIFIASLTGCFNPSFSSILEDVPPEKATINGVIRSIARYTVNGEEYLALAANGGLRYKKASESAHGAWKTASLPFDLLSYNYAAENSDKSSGNFNGEQILKVLSDSSNLYLINVTYKKNNSEGRVDPEKIKIWNAKISADADWKDKTVWKEVSIPERSDSEAIFQFYESSDYMHTRFNVFSTNAVQKANRFVYIRSGSKSNGTKYYKLDNGSITDMGSITAADGTTSNINGAAYLNGVKFFGSSAVCSNETLTSDATKIYYGNGKNLYTLDSTGIVQADGADLKINCGNEISCIGVTSGSLIVGRADYSTQTSTSGGVTRVLLDESSKLPVKTAAFETNASSQLSGAYLIFTLLVADPNKAEKDADIYSSIGFRGSGQSTSVIYDSVGLWSYYPVRNGTTGNWNRE